MVRRDQHLAAGLPHCGDRTPDAFVEHLDGLRADHEAACLGRGTGAGDGGPGGVRIRYLTADLGDATGGTETIDGAYTYHDFTTSGSFVATAPAARMRDMIGGGVGNLGLRNS